MSKRVELRMSKHIFNGREVVEIVIDGQVSGSIYPRDEGELPAVVIFSAHIQTVIEYSDGKEFAPNAQIPMAAITFKPRSYHVGPEGKLIYEGD